RAHTPPLARPTKPVTGPPVVIFSRANRVLALPLIVVNAPPTYTDSPSLAPIRARTDALALGLNPVSITPVVRLKARMRFRVRTDPPDAFCACVNVPPSTILGPTCARVGA